MKKVMISQPMRGKTNEEIREEREEIAIRLVEEGDIIVYTLNKMTVPKLTKVNIFKEARTFKEYLVAGGYKLDRVDILSITTKEQFENIEYKI